MLDFLAAFWTVPSNRAWTNITSTSEFQRCHKWCKSSIWVITFVLPANLTVCAMHLWSQGDALITGIALCWYRITDIPMDHLGHAKYPFTIFFVKIVWILHLQKGCYCKYNTVLKLLWCIYLHSWVKTFLSFLCHVHYYITLSILILTHGNLLKACFSSNLLLEYKLLGYGYVLGNLHNVFWSVKDSPEKLEDITLFKQTLK